MMFYNVLNMPLAVIDGYISILENPERGLRSSEGEVRRKSSYCHLLV